MLGKISYRSAALPALALLIAPVLSILISQWLVTARGPFNLGDNQDPEYCYLMNAINVASFQAPGHTDHPGTTLQLLGAAVITARWMLTRHPNIGLKDAVLADPESYLRALNAILNILVAAALFAAGWSMWRNAASLAAALLLQSGIFVFRENLFALCRVAPEPLMIAAVYALIALLLPVLWDRKAHPLAAGAVVAFGIVTKVTFLPLLLVVAMFTRWKDRWRFVAALLATGIILLLPIAEQRPRVWAWLLSIATHRGTYGAGEAGLPEADRLLRNLYACYVAEPYLFHFCALILLALVALNFAARPDPFVNSAKRLLWTGLLVITLQIAMTIKHYAAHYLLPSLIFTSFLIPAVYLILRAGALAPRIRRILAVACTAIFVIALWRSSGALRHIAEFASQYRDSMSHLAEVREHQQGCTTIAFYRSSAPGFALFFGDGFASRFSAPDLARLYPTQIFYERFGGHFETFDRSDVTARVKDLVDSGACLLLQGTSLDRDPLTLPRGLRIEPIEVTKSEGLYRLRPDERRP